MKLIRTKAVVFLEFYLVCGFFCLFAAAFASAQNCTPPAAGIVSWWKGESNTLDLIGTNNGTWSGGGPSYGPGEVGAAFSFNGNDCVRVADAPNLHFSNAMTAEAWVYPTTYNGGESILVKFDAVLGVNQSSFSFSLDSGGHVYLTLCSNGIPSGSFSVISTNTVPLNQWTHVAGTYDRSNLKVYINGALAGSIPAANSIFPGTDALGIGANIGGISGQVAEFIGLIDEPSLYNTALSASQIAAIYNAGSAGKCSSSSPPTISVQPQPESVPEGSNALFTVTATGTAPLNYQWQFNNGPIAGATASSLNITGAQPVNQGNYSVIVSNIAGVVVSSNVFLTVTGGSCTPPAAGLVSWWAGQSNTLDQVGTNNGTWSGGPSYGPGEVGAAFSFNGNDCVRVADAPSLHFTNAMTAEAWVNPSAYGNSILVKYDAVLGVNQSSFSFSLDSGGHLSLLVSFDGTPGNSSLVTSTNTVPLNQWTHVAGTYDRSNLKVYINGALAGSIPATNSIFPGTDALGIGANIGGISGQVAEFIGLIDEPSLYNTALSASQIAAIYNAGSAGKCTGASAPMITVQPKPETVSEGSNALFTVTATGTAPLNYQWQFNNAPISGATASSLNIADAQPANQGNYSVIVSNIAGFVTSSNAFLTVMSSTSCTPPATGIVSWWAGESNTLDQVGGNNGTWSGGGPAYGTGEVGTAFSLNGNDCVRVADAANLHFSNAMTAEAWVNPSAFGSSGESVLVKWDGVVGINESSFSFSLDSIGQVYLLVSSDGVPSHSTSATSSNTVPLNQWTHVAGTYDGNNLKVYINGVLAGTMPATNALFPGTDALGIGANIGGLSSGQLAGFSGLIDEASLYNTALSASQIAAIYNAGSAGKCTGASAPMITVQPKPESVSEGSNALFTVTASGTAPLNYQWQFNNAPIAGATASSLNIADAQPANQGNYSVIVSNIAGFVVSSNAFLTVVGSSSCTPPAAGLVSWWKGESNTLDQVGGNNGTWNGGPAYGAGEVGAAFSFNGSDYVRVLDAPNLHFTTAMTAEAWVDPSAYNANNAILVKYDAVLGVNQSAFSFSMDSGGHLYMLISSSGNGGSARVASTNTLPLNQWSHVAATFNSSNLVIYINGVQAGSIPATNSIFPGTDALGIGANIGGASPGQETALFSGLIDEASLYSTALSASQIAAIYNAGSAGKCTGVSAPMITVQPRPESVSEGSNALFTVTASGSAPLNYQWQFNNAPISGATLSSLNIADAQPANQGNYSVIVSNIAGFVVSSNAFLTVVGSSSCTPPAAGLVSWWKGESNTLDQVGGNNGTWNGGPAYGAGEVGAAFSFNGSDYVRVPDAPNLRFTTAMTAEAWINPSSINGVAILVKYDAVPGPNQSAFSFSLDPSGHPYLLINFTGVGGSSVQVTAPNPVPANQWTHLAGTYDGSTLSIYVNGVLASSMAASGSIFPGTDALGIGANIGGESPGGGTALFSGLIDEASLYNTALSASQIAAIYNAGSAGKCTGPVAPAIVDQPQSETVNSGSTAMFSVTASGSVPLFYQWSDTNGAIIGATNSSLTISNAQKNDSYFVVVSNSIGSVTSSNALLTILVPTAPSITMQPQPQTVTAGSNAFFTVTATGTAPLNYQWRFNSAPITGATSSSLKITDAQPANQGNYSVTVSNIAGFVTSSNALLTVNIPACTPPAAGIVSWWKGESNTLDQVGGNNGAWNGGGPAYAAGEVGAAFSFNGRDYVRVPDAPNLRFTNAMTAEAWINPSSIDGVAILVKYDAVPGPNQSAFSFSLDPSGHPYLLINFTGVGGSSVQVTAPNPVPANQWTHLAGTYDGSTLSIYVNGVLASSMAASGSIFPGTDALGIGANIGGESPGGGTALFSGLIDEATLYDTALSASQVAAIYNAGPGGKCPATVAPSITVQPQNETVGAGSNAFFAVQAAGSIPLAYQWSQNSNIIAGATNSSLVVSNVQLAQSGSAYSVTVSNPYGTVVSSNAILTVLPPPSAFIIPNITASSGIVTVPINFISDGSENAIGFSVNFNSSLLTFVSADAGTNVSATLIVNSNDASSGQVGLAISLPFNTTFTAGSNVLADLTFDLVPPPNTNTTVTSITFGNTPIPEQVYDPTPNQLAAVFTNGSLTIPFLGFEGDVFPMPNGDGKVLLNDWVEEGRLVAGLDAITSSSEFQRADCAPRSTLGDGRLTVSDWVQAGRYAAGLDPLTVAGGPTTPIPGGGNNVVTGNGVSHVMGRTLNVASGAVQAGQTCQISVLLASQGDENGLEFSLSFPPAVLSYVSASLGSNATGASLILNTSQAGSGNLGVLLGMPIGSSFAAGSDEVLKLTLKAAPIAAGDNSISFNSLPLTQEVSDVTATAVSSSYFSGSVTVVPVVGPTLSVVPGKANGLSFSYPSSASGFILQSTTTLNPSSWTNAVVTQTTNGNTITATGSAGNSQIFYRLISP